MADGLTWTMDDQLSRYFVEAERKFPGFATSSIRVLGLRGTAALAFGNRVDTGRSRIAWTPIFREPWAGGAQPRLSNVPARGVSGRHSAADVKRAQQEGLRKGSVREKSSASTHTVAVTNAVEYVPFLDARYPFVGPAMRRGLNQWRSEVRRDLREAFG